ncbi:MAG: nucleotide exchange factor GrpE [Candidatus Nanopelagicales bacterium]
MTAPYDEGHEASSEGIRFTDRRRIDPVTYEVREPVPPAPSPADAEQVAAEEAFDRAAADADVAAAQEQVASLTDDLRRLTAEYANYRKRVERDREAVREQAVASAVNELLPVLDDIDRARDHDELVGAFKTVGESLVAATGRLGLVRFGEVGEPFDPTVHEALTHEVREGVSEPTVATVYQAGYRIGDRIVRPARVGVADSA